MRWFIELNKNFTLQVIESKVCIPPCNTTAYGKAIRYYHENYDSQWPEKSSDANKSFVLYYFFDSLLLEERIETVVFDLDDFFSSAGGNLGLFLGFSCLSVLFSFISGIKYASKFFKVSRSNKIGQFKFLNERYTTLVFVQFKCRKNDYK